MSGKTDMRKGYISGISLLLFVLYPAFAYLFIYQISLLPAMLKDFTILATFINIAVLLSVMFLVADASIVNPFLPLTRGTKLLNATAVALLAFFASTCLSMVIKQAGVKYTFFLFLKGGAVWFTISALSRIRNGLDSIIGFYISVVVIFAMLGIFTSFIVNTGLVNPRDWVVNMNDLVGLDIDWMQPEKGEERYTFPLFASFVIPYDFFEVGAFKILRISGYSSEPNVAALLAEPAFFLAFFLRLDRNIKYTVIAILLLYLFLLGSGATIFIFLVFGGLWLIRVFITKKVPVMLAGGLILFYMLAMFIMSYQFLIKFPFLHNEYFMVKAGTINRSFAENLQALNSLQKPFGEAFVTVSNGELVPHIAHSFGYVGFVLFFVSEFLLGIINLYLISSDTRLKYLGYATMAYSIHMVKAGFWDTFLYLFLIALSFYYCRRMAMFGAAAAAA